MNNLCGYHYYMYRICVCVEGSWNHNMTQQDAGHGVNYTGIGSCDMLRHVALALRHIVNTALVSATSQIGGKAAAVEE